MGTLLGLGFEYFFNQVADDSISAGTQSAFCIGELEEVLLVHHLGKLWNGIFFNRETSFTGIEAVEVDIVGVGIEIAYRMEVDTCHNVSLAVGVQMKVVDGILVGLDNPVVPFVVVKMN